MRARSTEGKGKGLCVRHLPSARHYGLTSSLVAQSSQRQMLPRKLRVHAMDTTPCPPVPSFSYLSSGDNKPTSYRCRESPMR